MGLRRLAILGWVWSGCGDVARPRVSIAPAEPGTDDDLVAVPPPGLDELYDWTWSRDGRVVPELRGDRVPAAL
ncbi:MAG: hypothetical protein ABMB14_40915, partial [Myxococcota bacterium]